MSLSYWAEYCRRQAGVNRGADDETHSTTSARAVAAQELSAHLRHRRRQRHRSPSDARADLREGARPASRHRILDRLSRSRAFTRSRFGVRAARAGRRGGDLRAFGAAARPLSLQRMRGNRRRGLRDCDAHPQGARAAARFQDRKRTRDVRRPLRGLRPFALVFSNLRMY
jgi:hypothetical protein